MAGFEKCAELKERMFSDLKTRLTNVHIFNIALQGARLKVNFCF